MTATTDFEDRLAARLLGVDVDADASTIRARFRRLALAVHPDTAVADAGVDLGRLAAAKQRLIARANARTDDFARWAARERHRRAETDARTRMVRIRREEQARRRLERVRALADLDGLATPTSTVRGGDAGVPRRRSASVGRVGQLIDVAG